MHFSVVFLMTGAFINEIERKVLYNKHCNTGKNAGKLLMHQCSSPCPAFCRWIFILTISFIVGFQYGKKNAQNCNVVHRLPALYGNMTRIRLKNILFGPDREGIVHKMLNQMQKKRTSFQYDQNHKDEYDVVLAICLALEDSTMLNGNSGGVCLVSAGMTVLSLPCIPVPLSGKWYTEKPDKTVQYGNGSTWQEPNPRARRLFLVENWSKEGLMAMVFTRLPLLVFTSRTPSSPLLRHRYDFTGWS